MFQLGCFKILSVVLQVGYFPEFECCVLGGLLIYDVRDPTFPEFVACDGDDGYTHVMQCILYHGPDGDYKDHEICFSNSKKKKK